MTFVEALKSQDRAELTRLLASIGDINTLDEHGWTLLHWAAGSGDLIAVKELIARGADVFRRGRDQRTPYLVALAAAHCDVVGYLREEEDRRGGDVDRLSSRRGERRPYCKAYLLGQLRAFDGWSEASGPPSETGAEDSDETVVFLHQDHSVTRSPLHGQSVIFASSSADWQAFCASALGFAVPRDIDLLSGSQVSPASHGVSSRGGAASPEGAASPVGPSSPEGMASRGRASSALTFDDQHYEALRDLLLREFGIELRDVDPAYAEAKICAYCAKQGVSSLAECLELVARDPSKLQELGDVVHSHTTMFNRWPAAFTFMVDRLSHDTLERDGRDVVVWSVGCSTGQEPYTVAVYLLEHVYAGRHPAFRVVATDCSPEALRIAALGRYALDDVRRLEPIPYQRYFAEADEGHLTVRAHVREHVTFHHFNLLTSDYAAIDLVDVALLLVEPHTPEASAAIVKKVRGVLRDGGYLIAHEELPVPRDEIERCGFRWIQGGYYRAVASSPAA